MPSPCFSSSHYFTLCALRTEQIRALSPAISAQAPMGRTWRASSSRQLPRLANMKLFLDCVSLVICLSADWSLRSAEEPQMWAVITRTQALSGTILCFTSLWSHAADDTATNPCVWERGKFYLTKFLSNISFKCQLRSTIDNIRLKLLVIGLKVRANGNHGFLFQFKNIISLIKICQIQAWGRHILCLDVFCALLWCYGYSDQHSVHVSCCCDLSNSTSNSMF